MWVKKQDKVRSRVESERSQTLRSRDVIPSPTSAILPVPYSGEKKKNGEKKSGEKRALNKQRVFQLTKVVVVHWKKSHLSRLFFPTRD